MPRIVGASRRYRIGGPGTRGIHGGAVSSGADDHKPYWPGMDCDHTSSASTTKDEKAPIMDAAEIARLTEELDRLLERATRAILRKRSWRRHYKRLKKFVRQHGHCRVPLFVRRGDSLGMWLELQRRRFRHHGDKAFWKKKYLHKLNQLAPNWLEDATTDAASVDQDDFSWKEETGASGSLPGRNIKVSLVTSDDEARLQDSIIPAKQKLQKKVTDTWTCDHSSATRTTDPCSSVYTSCHDEEEIGRDRCLQDSKESNLNCPTGSNDSSAPPTNVDVRNGTFASVLLDQELNVNLEDDGSIWSFAEANMMAKCQDFSPEPPESQPTLPHRTRLLSTGGKRPQSDCASSTFVHWDMPPPDQCPKVGSTPNQGQKRTEDCFAVTKTFWLDPKQTSVCPDSIDEEDISIYQDHRTNARCRMDSWSGSLVFGVEDKGENKVVSYPQVFFDDWR